MTSRKGLALAAIDLLGALFLIALVQMGPPPKPKSAVKTYGQYAVTITWPAKCAADEDLALRDPAGHIAFYNAKSFAGMHLENDDIPNNTGYRDNPNFERVVIRVVSPGEYVAGVHTYDDYDCPYAAVTAQLWRLAGDDSLVYQRRVMMRGYSDEQTVFRFSLRADGDVYGINLLPRRLVG
jgi:hypothetical protein